MTYWNIRRAEELSAEDLRARGLDPSNTAALAAVQIVPLEDSPPQADAGFEARRVGANPVPVWEGGRLVKMRWNYELADLLAERRAALSAQVDALHAECMRLPAGVRTSIGGRDYVVDCMAVADAGWLCCCPNQGPYVPGTTMEGDRIGGLALTGPDAYNLAGALANYAVASHALRDELRERIAGAQDMAALDDVLIPGNAEA